MMNLIVMVVLSQWNPGVLNRDLYPVAYLESSFGKNVDHMADLRGPKWTAVGPLGLKPVTAYDTYRNVNWFRAKYPYITIENIENALKTDRSFYIDACNAHWNYIRYSIPDITKAVYAWRWGIRAANEASWQMVAFDSYVINYMYMRHSSV